MTTREPLSTHVDELVAVPRLHRVVDRRTQTDDVVTLLLESLDGECRDFRPGQFNMLSVPGIGEIAVSLSDAPRSDGLLHHCVRAVGLVSSALWASRVGDVVGVRGPFGSDWRLAGHDEAVDSSDVVVVAGGLGLAPLRGAANELVAARGRGGGRVFILVGAREPSQVLFGDDLARWSREGAFVDVTVDRGSPGWTGHVGLVTSLLADARFDPARTRALVCGPEIMMRFSARALEDMGVDPQRILVSLERNMQCGVGWCGHCQLGPFLLCRDGPVLPYAPTVRELLEQRER